MTRPTEKADMNAKHTPGPWKVTESMQIGGGRAGDLIQVKADEDTVIAGCGRAVIESHRANAALIAASPTMYEALEEIVRHHAALNDERGRSQSNSFTLRIARAALAKASGAP